MPTPQSAESKLDKLKFPAGAILVIATLVILADHYFTGGFGLPSKIAGVVAFASFLGFVGVAVVNSVTKK